MSKGVPFNINFSFRVTFAFLVERNKMRIVIDINIQRDKTLKYRVNNT